MITHSATITKLATAMLAVQGVVDGVRKDATNPPRRVKPKTLCEATLAMAAVPGIMQPGEFWIESYDHPGYMVSSEGRVVSLRRTVPFVMRPTPIAGYPSLALASRAGPQRTVSVHRLVAEAFHGPAPPGHAGRHLDGDRSNSRLRNLRWGTPAANTADKYVHGTILRGSQQANAKLHEADIPAIRSMRSDGLSYRSIAARYGVTIQAIRAVVTGATWSHVL